MMKFFPGVLVVGVTFLILGLGVKTIYADWLIDLLPPVASVDSFSAFCSSPASPPFPIYISASDPGDSKVASISWELKDSAGNSLSPVVGGQATPPTTTAPYPDGQWQINSFGTNTPATGQKYYLYIQPVDNVGNTVPWIKTNFIINWQPNGGCQTPWVKTINGDVHSNGAINATGG